MSASIVVLGFFDREGEVAWLEGVGEEERPFWSERNQKFPLLSSSINIYCTYLGRVFVNKSIKYLYLRSLST